MPEGMRLKAEASGRYVLFVIDALLLVGVFYLAWRHRLPPDRMGVRLDHWETHALVGCFVGLAWEALKLAAAFLSPPSSSLRANDFMRGSAFLWIVIFLTGSIAAEVWRAFTLVTLITSGHSAELAVMMSAIAFGIGHLRLRLGGALGAAVAGAVFAVLFLWSGTLVAPFAAHFTANTAHMYWLRRIVRTQA